MKTLTPYLSFSGSCMQALEFYKEAFHGEIIATQTFGDAPMDIPADQKHRILHSKFKAEGLHFFASDNMPGDEVRQGSQVSLTITLDNKEEQQAIFEKLAFGGNITMPLEKTFWGAIYGMVTDKFGMHWMLNCEVAE